MPSPAPAEIAPFQVENNSGGGDSYKNLIATQGALRTAVNLGHSGPDLVVNGVTFASTPGVSPSGPGWNTFGPAVDDGLSNPGLDDLFFSEIWGGNPVRLSFVGLDPTHTYLVQLLHGEPRNCCQTTYTGNRFFTNADPVVIVPAFTIGNGINAENPPAENDVALLTTRVAGVTGFTYDIYPNATRGASMAGFQVRDLGLTSVRVTTIDITDRFAWGENIGWTDWRHDTGVPGKGAIIGQYFCSGFVWGENMGWIQLGNGAPADRIRYSNTDAADYGVNHDGQGKLSGLAWGENIGWVKFDQSVSEPPRVDLATGKLSGYAYGENVGWLDLGSNGTAFVRTNTIDEGLDTDFDMIADAWELEQAAGAGLSSSLTLLDKTSDRDGDGVSDFEEYLSDSDPFDRNDLLELLSGVRDLDNETIDLEWRSSPRRLYDLYWSSDLVGDNLESGDIVPDPGSSTTRSASSPAAEVRRFWQVRARRPLSP